MDPLTLFISFSVAALLSSVFLTSIVKLAFLMILRSVAPGSKSEEEGGKIPPRRLMRAIFA